MLSERLINLRERKDYTKKYISGILNITPSAYSFYETGKNTPPLVAIEKLADFYNVTTDYLLGRKCAAINTAGEFDEFTDLIDDIKELPTTQQQQVFEYVRLLKLDNAILGHNTKKKAKPPISFSPSIAASGIGIKKMDAEMSADAGKAFDNKEIKE